MARSIVMPSMGMYMAEGTVMAWLRPPQADVASGEPIAEVETEKATFEIGSPTAGILWPLATVGTKVPVEGILGYILAPGETPPSSPSDDLAAPRPEKPGFPQAAGTGGSQVPVAAPTTAVRASPIAKRLAAQHAIDLTGVTGRGPGGRIVEADILAAVAQRDARAVTPEDHAPRIRERIPLTGLRRTIAERLRESKATAVALTITREARVDALVAARRRLVQKIGDLPYDALFIKLLAAGLRECPDLNATILNDAILILDEVHIGFAVAVPGGVVVPVIRSADSQSLIAIATAVRELSERAVRGRLRAEETTHGTATITNLGAHGVDAFTPVLNPPQSAILGVGRIAERPYVEDGRIVAARTCMLSLTFDHRVADGVPAARLLEAVAHRMSDTSFLGTLCEF